jgi:hypothetical protein
LSCTWRAKSYARENLGVKKDSPPSKNLKKCPIICFAPDKRNNFQDFQNHRYIGIFISQRERERESKSKSKSRSESESESGKGTGKGKEMERGRERKRERDRERDREREREREREITKR